MERENKIKSTVNDLDRHVSNVRRKDISPRTAKESRR